MLIAALLAMQAAAETPRIIVSTTAEGYRAEVAAFDLAQEVHVNAEIERRAIDLCADKPIRWGEFGSSAEIDKDLSKGPPKITGFFKEFRCVVPQAPTVASVPSEWKADPKDEADVRRFFETYYSKRDSGQFAAAAAMFQADMQEKPRVEYLREFNQKLGAGRRRITGVTWYVNPAAADRLGAYAALDFAGEYTGSHLYCGYLVLYRLGPGRYEIVREEQNVFHKGDKPADPAQLEAMRAAACRGS